MDAADEDSYSAMAFSADCDASGVRPSCGRVQPLELARDSPVFRSDPEPPYGLERALRFCLGCFVAVLLLAMFRVVQRQLARQREANEALAAGRCPYDNGGCCLGCSASRFCPNDGGCYNEGAGADGGCAGELCPAPAGNQSCERSDQSDASDESDSVGVRDACRGPLETGYTWHHSGFWDNGTPVCSTDSLRSCSQACSADADCVAFSLPGTTGPRQCYTYRAIGVPRVLAGAYAYASCSALRAGHVLALDSRANCNRHGLSRRFAFSHGGFWLGGAPQGVTGSAAICARICESRDHCTGLSWGSFGRQCHLYIGDIEGNYEESMSQGVEAYVRCPHGERSEDEDEDSYSI